MDLVQSDLGAYFMTMGVSFQGWEDEPVWFIDSEQLQEYNFYCEVNHISTWKLVTKILVGNINLLLIHWCLFLKTK